LHPNVYKECFLLTRKEMKMASYEELKAQLLYKLYRKGKWGGAHTPLRNLFHLMDNASIKDSEKAAKELANLELVYLKISTGEKHISLNSHKSREIKEYIISVLKINPKLLK